jgi:threonine dehydrogenase-like Zn-dependent dehydrogenase
VVKLPLRDGAVPGEPLGCAFNIFRRSDIAPGQTVAIVGIGFLGAVLTRLATDAGARVIAISRRPFSLDLARRYGAAETIPMDDHWAIIERVKALTGERDVRAGDRGGRQAMAARPGRRAGGGRRQAGRRRLPPGRAAPGQHADVELEGHRRGQRPRARPAVQMQGLREAVEAVASGRLDPAPLYTHEYPLERLGEALDATRDRPDGFLKALVTL